MRRVEKKEECMAMNKKEEDRKQEEKRRDKKEGREKSPRDKSDMVKETLSFILYIAIVFLVTYLVIHYVGQRTQVSGTSMEYTLSDGDNLIVDKISYRFHEPERFDIIVFPFRYKEDTYYIKRIIGLPGETVQIDDEGNIYIDGEVLEESYGREIILDPGEAASPIELGDGEYLCWEITGTQVQTAGIPVWVKSSEKILSEEPGCVSIPLTGLGLSNISRKSDSGTVRRHLRIRGAYSGRTEENQ